ncbi:hypothetical protein COCON_G00144800 [Conger conger]|uniref:Uncharacterized protein n=1 Tax=Conger conger TaxID=82655 RepID=A0A9Q1DBH4_CONCO|nr:hypothetical protein COCON_G00144800 [Conger conger]
MQCFVPVKLKAAVACPLSGEKHNRFAAKRESGDVVSGPPFHRVLVFHVFLVIRRGFSQIKMEAPQCLMAAERAEQPRQERKLCAHPFIEIYQGSTIHFMGPLARQSDFYIPELQEDSEDSEEEDRRTDVTGAGSNSETSSMSHMMSGSRESSLARSSVPTLTHRPQRSDRDHWSDRSSNQSSSSFEDLDLELVEKQEETAAEVPCSKPLDVTPEEREAVAEGEE